MIIVLLNYTNLRALKQYLFFSNILECYVIFVLSKILNYFIILILNTWFYHSQPSLAGSPTPIE